MQPFSLLVKPASADCNLRCEYCFYLDHCAFYPGEAKHRMSDDVLKRMIQSYMATRQPQYAFGWQGGEPTLMGVEFFRRAVEYQKTFGSSAASVGNGLQTNGVLIDDDMARLFGQYHFLVGVSLDGPRALHDTYRHTAGGGGSYAAVRQGLAKLREHRVEFNILTLVSRANVRHPREVYQFLCDQDYLYHQYIPCVEGDGAGGVLPFAIDGDEWGDFLCGVFDAWRPNDTRRVSIRLFDSILLLLVDGVRNICHLGNNCCQYFVVEYNGDVFPCDFFVEKQLRLGNVMHDSWASLQQSPVYVDFGSKKLQMNDLCRDCEYAWVCVGDCLKHRFCANGGNPRRLSHLCSGWKRFFDHTLDSFQELARDIRRDRMRDTTAARAAGGPVGRNDPCPCGSGRKYKKCCG